MIFIDSKSCNANFNFALEKYLMFELDLDEDYFLFWRTEPTLMVGKFQNAIQEINMDFVRKHNINVVRRITGGGTIYTDFNGWQFSFITKNPSNEQINFKYFTQPIIDALASLDVTAYNSGRNDLMVDGKKISGNALYVSKSVVLHHGSILFNTDLDRLVRALNVEDEKIISKGIKSVKERVTNVSDHMDKKITSEDFKDLMIQHLTKDMDTYSLLSIDSKRINEIKETCFDTWEWTFGKSPKFNITKEKRYSGGKLLVSSLVDKGTIKDIAFYGDFFERRDLKILKDTLINCRYTKESIKLALESANAGSFIFTITLNDIFDLII